MEDDSGIIPRVIGFLYEEIGRRQSQSEFLVKCTFMEIYNEELHDLLDPVGCSVDRYLQRNQKEISVREEKSGNIAVYGLQEDKVATTEEMVSCLNRGSNFRSTSSTLMNNASSRSHAIFTITIEQHRIEDLYKATPDEGEEQKQEKEKAKAKEEGDGAQTIDEFMVAKFHFVDLAGSERVKKTGATGNTLKEGISIN